MKNSIYQINKGVNRSIEFRGLKAQYIWYLLIGVILLLLLFALLYIIGLGAGICFAVILPLAGGYTYKIYRWSDRYGEHGMSKAIAKKRVPKALISTNRKTFFHPKKINP